MFFFRLLSYLPFPVLYLISDFLSFFAFYILRYRKKVVFENLKNSFPEKNSTEINEIAKCFYRNLSDIVVEIIKEITISREELARRVEFVDVDEPMQLLNDDKSILVVATHQCNWEWLLLSAGVFSNKPVDVLYMPLTNKRFDNFMLKIRSRFGGHPIAVKNTVREVARRSKISRVMALLADQTPTTDSDIYWYEFLNQETAFYKGPYVLAKFTKYPVYYTEMTRLKRGYYRVKVIKVASPPYSENSDILPSFIKLGQETIQNNPADWLWSHRRWKVKKT